MKFGAYQLILQLSAIFKPFIAILLGYSLSKTRLNSSIKLWILTIALNLSICIGSILFFKEISISNIYDSILPILRNSLPTISGILVGCLLLNPIKKLLKQIPVKIFYISLVSILMPGLLFNQDILLFNNGNSFYFGLICFLIGIKIAQSHKKIGNIPLIISLLSVNLILNIIMMFVSSAMNQDLSTANRFISSSSFFSIVIAIILISHFKFSINLKDAYFIFCNFLISYSFIMINFENKLQLFSSTKIKLIISLLISILIMLLCWVAISILFKIKNHLRLNNTINNNFKEFNIIQFIQQLKNFLVSHSSYIYSLLTFYILAFLSIILMNSSWTISPNVDKHYNIFIYTIFMRQNMILLNTFLISLLFMIFLICIKKFWVAHGITTLLVGTYIIINKLKITARDEPILPSDLSMLKSTTDLLGMINFSNIIMFILIILLFTIVIFILEKKFPKHISISKRIIAFFIIILCFCTIGTLRLNHSKSFSNIFISSLGNDPEFFNQLAGAQINGPIQQFLNNVDMKVMDVPSGYSKKSMEKISNKYSTEKNKINSTRKNNISKQTIIFNLSESFSDPTRVPNLKINKDPMPYIRSLKATTTSGIMMSSGYGGGTANMEYMALTGLSLSNFAPTLTTPFTQLVGELTYNPSLPQWFKKTSAIHPYVGTFYNRSVAYKKLGIDKFSFLGSTFKIKHQSKIENSPYLSDNTAYANLLDQINNINSGQFISLATMQNHFPFDKNYYSNSKFKISGSVIDKDDTRKSIKDYVAGVNYTDKSVKKFISKIDKINKPITVVWYGDHLPGIYSGDDMSKYESQLHETDYFIYSNKFARNQGIGTNKLNYKYTDPNNFASILLDQTNSKVSSFYAFMTKMQNDFPAISVSTSGDNSVLLTDNNGNKVKESSLTKKQKKLYHEYKLIQYDIVSGNNYLSKSFYEVK